MGVRVPKFVVASLFALACALCLMPTAAFALGEGEVDVYGPWEVLVGSNVSPVDEVYLDDEPISSDEYTLKYISNSDYYSDWEDDGALTWSLTAPTEIGSYVVGVFDSASATEPREERWYNIVPYIVEYKSNVTAGGDANPVTSFEPSDKYTIKYATRADFAAARKNGVAAPWSTELPTKVGKYVFGVFANSAPTELLGYYKYNVTVKARYRSWISADSKNLDPVRELFPSTGYYVQYVSQQAYDLAQDGDSAVPWSKTVPTKPGKWRFGIFADGDSSTVLRQYAYRIYHAVDYDDVIFGSANTNPIKSITPSDGHVVKYISYDSFYEDETDEQLWQKEPPTKIGRYVFGIFESDSDTEPLDYEFYSVRFDIDYDDVYLSSNASPIRSMTLPSGYVVKYISEEEYSNDESHGAQWQKEPPAKPGYYYFGVFESETSAEPLEVHEYGAYLDVDVASIVALDAPDKNPIQSITPNNNYVIKYISSSDYWEFEDGDGEAPWSTTVPTTAGSWYAGIFEDADDANPLDIYRYKIGIVFDAEYGLLVGAPNMNPIKSMHPSEGFTVKFASEDDYLDNGDKAIWSTTPPTNEGWYVYGAFDSADAKNPVTYGSYEVLSSINLNWYDPEDEGEGAFVYKTQVKAGEKPLESITLAGKKLVEGVDYDVSYYTQDNYGDLTAPRADTSKPGKYLAVITGKGTKDGGVYGRTSFKFEVPQVPGTKPAAQTGGQAVSAGQPAAAQAAPVGTGVKASGASYKVTKSGASPEVAFTKAPSKATVKVPDKVVVGSVSYKVTSIAAKAFKGNKKVKKVTVGANVKTIGASAFQKCPKLKAVTLGKGVKTIGKAVFKGDKKLKKLTVKSGSLTKKSVKNALKGSKIKTIKLSGKAAKAKKKAYKKYAGKKVTVK